MSEERRQEVVRHLCQLMGMPEPTFGAALALPPPSSAQPPAEPFRAWTPAELREFQALLQRAGSVRRLLDALRAALGVARDGEGLDPAAQSRRMQRVWHQRDYQAPEPR
jgi:hypothetical protein